MIACTVVIPAYNRVRVLGRALDSALGQTRADFELLVIDDGSSDASAELALARGDARVRVLRQENAGHCAARNLGIAEARGEWVAFLDSDDEWRPRFLERALALAEGRGGLAAVFTDMLSVKDGRAWLGDPPGEPRLLESYLSFAVAHGGRGMSCSSTVARRAALIRAGGFPAGVKRSGDVETWLRLALQGDVGFVPETLAVYHNESPGIAALHPEPVYPAAARTARRLLAEGGLPRRAARELPRLEALYLLIHARDLIDYGARRRARELLIRDCAWRHCPPLSLAKALLRSIGI